MFGDAQGETSSAESLRAFLKEDVEDEEVDENAAVAMVDEKEGSSFEVNKKEVAAAAAVVAGDDGGDEGDEGDEAGALGRLVVAPLDASLECLDGVADVCAGLADEAAYQACLTKVRQCRLYQDSVVACAGPSRAACAGLTLAACAFLLRGYMGGLCARGQGTPAAGLGREGSSTRLAGREGGAATAPPPLRLESSLSQEQPRQQQQQQQQQWVVPEQEVPRVVPTVAAAALAAERALSEVSQHGAIMNCVGVDGPRRTLSYLGGTDLECCLSGPFGSLTRASACFFFSFFFGGGGGFARLAGPLEPRLFGLAHHPSPRADRRCPRKGNRRPSF